MSVVVIDIGCLECSNPSDLLGVYPSIEVARAAHPDVKPRSDLDGWNAWHRSSMIVAFELPDAYPEGDKSAPQVTESADNDH